uniref:C-type lectin domain-containing protein n=1 Tax=Panagrolaimus sp. JU765 TaxID=591449 RepID=A0AC34RS32_9BILA
MFISYLVYDTWGDFKYYWIGGTMRTVMINAQKSVDLWTWTKGDALMIFSDWDPSAPATGNCTSVDRTALWSAIDCLRNNIFVCEIPAKVNEFCDDGWAHFNLTHSCYRKFSVITAINQTTTESYCVQKGGHLASIHSAEENRFIGELTSIGYNTTDYASVFWIGAVRDGNADNWRWIDKTPFDYSNFGNDYDYTNDFCVNYWPDSTTTYPNNPMVWNPDRCAIQLFSYLCKKESYKA